MCKLNLLFCSQLGFWLFLAQLFIGPTFSVRRRLSFIHLIYKGEFRSFLLIGYFHLNVSVPFNYSVNTFAETASDGSVTWRITPLQDSGHSATSPSDSRSRTLQTRQTLYGEDDQSREWDWGANNDAHPGSWSGPLAALKKLLKNVLQITLFVLSEQFDPSRPLPTPHYQNQKSSAQKGNTVLIMFLWAALGVFVAQILTTLNSNQH